MRRAPTFTLALAVAMALGEPLVPAAQAEQPRVRWPRNFSITTTTLYERSDWANERFEEPFERVDVSGDMVGLAPSDAVGLSVRLGYTFRFLRGEVGLGYGTPIVSGDPSLPFFGPRAETRRVHFAHWTMGLMVRHRFKEVAPFGGVQVGVEQAPVDVENPTALLRARRASFGPRVGFRAHIHRLVFIEAAGTMNLLRAPDFSLGVALGVGNE